MNKIEYVTGRDGNAWFCHGPNFINLQESPCAYGDTELEAMLSYVKLIYSQWWL